MPAISIVQLDGELDPGGSGIIINGANVTVRGFVVNRFQGVGIIDAGVLGGSLSSNYSLIYHDKIVGNYVGTDVTGLVAEPNGTGMLLGGIGGGFFQIGGTTAADRNIISGNSSDGIQIDAGTTFTIQGNYIGVGVDGSTPLGNGGSGVDVTNANPFSFHAQDIHVGGPDADEGNIIAYNNYGVENNEADFLGPVISTSTSVLSNSIYANKVLGISLDENNNFFNSVLASGNDRQPQNYPVLNTALSSGGQTTITGYLNSAPDQSFTIQLFSNVGAAFTNFAQGAQYLGSVTVTTDDNGHASFNATFNVSLAPHTLITATATDQENETSPFSARLGVGDDQAGVYVVNTTDDSDVGYADPAHLTLREAILAANNHLGPDTIEFDIPGVGVQTISPIDPLPDIEDGVNLDGSSQPGYAGTPLIQLSGASMDPSAENLGFNPRLRLVGLSIHADNTTVRGLDINSFYRYITSGTSILDQGGQPLWITGDSNVVAGDFIGTDPTGTIAKPNLNDTSVAGNNNRIGGTTAADRNLFTGNWYGELSVSGSKNVIQGNYIGTDITGTKALETTLLNASSGGGLSVSGDNATVGGSAPGAGNLISGNPQTPFALFDAAGSVVQGNIIGLDITGTKTIGNGGDGIDVNSDGFDPQSGGVQIGGPLASERNLISGNGNGIDLTTDDNTVQGNLIGTDITGLVALANGSDGIRIQGSNNLIGGPGAGDGNVISGNHGMGVRLDVNGTRVGPTGNKVQGNLIGVGEDGVTPLGNSADGVGVTNQFSFFNPSPSGDLVGGLDPGDGNIIAYNRSGVDVYQGAEISILSNSIFNNIGLGIDLGLDGVTPNDPGDADTGDNNLQNYPVIGDAVSDGRTPLLPALSTAPLQRFSPCSSS